MSDEDGDILREALDAAAAILWEAADLLSDRAADRSADAGLVGHFTPRPIEALYALSEYVEEWEAT